MFFSVLAADYDGTLADHGLVTEATLAGLEQVRQSGRRLILVTGRRLEDLQEVFPKLDLFDRVIAENGAILHRPAEKQTVSLAEPPPAAFIDALRARGVAPLSVGRVIIASREPQQDAILDVINEFGLELQIVFNKGAVMVLPSGINKASGALATLRELALSPINAVAIGDGENDHALLKACGCAVAVANAVPALKDAADWVTSNPRGADVVELTGWLLRDDLASMTRWRQRYNVLLGESKDGPVMISATGADRILLCGASASGKSTFTMGLLERLSAIGMQYCIIDPEGDYEGFGDIVSVGDAHQEPSIASIVELLERPEQNVAANLLGVALADRPDFFLSLLAALLRQRERAGRPHWIVVDEAHHVLPRENETAAAPLAADLARTIFITVHPDHMARSILSSAQWLVTLGSAAKDWVQAFAVAARKSIPANLPSKLEGGRALAWRIAADDPPIEITIAPPQREHLRHVRKYAIGELGKERSFYFRGPGNKLNLRAQNLEMFCQLAVGVDEDTWRHHLAAGDYSRWLRESIKDEGLADEVAALEARGAESGDSRAAICAAIEKRYSKPA